jgi:ATP phosphoribosyltransferase
VTTTLCQLDPGIGASLATDRATLRLGLPKGRMQEGILRLLGEAGIGVRLSARGYRPAVSLPGIDAKILKPQNIVEMLAAGSRDVGFAGADWVRELGAELVEVLDTGLDPVRLVAATPLGVDLDQPAPGRTLIVASEYEQIATQWIRARRLNARFVRSYGATEVFPPDDADCILDVAASGDTLRANGLTIVDEVMTSSTRLYANRESLNDPERWAAIERLALLLRSALEARLRVMVEVNVSENDLERVIAALPCMREATISRLHGSAGYAVKAAVPRDGLALLIPDIKSKGGADIVVTSPTQIIP